MTRCTHVSLRGFRSWRELELDLPAGLVVMAGANGVGKTNLLEAIAVALTGASPRTAHLGRCLRHGEALFRVVVTCDRAGDQHVCAAALAPGEPLRRSCEPPMTSDDRIPVATFLPERLLIVRGAPIRRRALMDRLAAAIDATVVHSQRHYNEALRQRNTLLRRARTGAQFDERALAPWTEAVITHGTVVRQARATALARMAPFVEQRIHELTGFSGGELIPVLRGDVLYDALEATAAEERRAGRTLVGPHLDDLGFWADGRSLREHGSAGEQRSALLATTLAERDIVAELTGHDPILLLDEPLAELDDGRRERLLGTLADIGQVLITATGPLRSDVAATLLRVADGTVCEWESAATTT